MRTLLVVATVVAVALLAAGCGGVVVGSTRDNREFVEQMVEKQMPEQAKSIFGQDAVVWSVECVSAGNDTYECIADLRVGGEQLTVPVSATCDVDACLWRVSP